MGSRQLVGCLLCTYRSHFFCLEMLSCPCLTWLCIPGHLALASGASIRPFLLFEPIAARFSDSDSHYALG